MSLIKNPLFAPLFAPVVQIMLILFTLAVVACAAAWTWIKPELRKELVCRILSWAVIAVLFLAALFCGAAVSLCIFGFILIRAVMEFASMAKLPRVFTTLMVLMVPVSISVLVWGKDVARLPLLFLAVYVLAALRSNRIESFGFAVSSLFASIWLIYMMLHVRLLGTSSNGILLLSFTGIAAALSDIGSYTFGKLLSLTPARSFLLSASNISPNKTIPGYFGGVCAVAGVTAMFYPLLKTQTIPVFLFPLVIPCAAAAGDLAESLVKRFYAVKESGSLIPGHGGVLDRLDSFIPSVTAVYYLNLVF